MLRLISVFLFLIAGAHSFVRQTDFAKAELEEYIASAKKTVNPRYRLTYHIAAPVGWINDPNGFSYYNGEYHLFYQYYPYDSVWGPMHWGHVSSPDLVNWQQLPTALLPEEEMCFSGSAIIQDDTMILMYTGQVTTNTDPFYNQTQYLAFSDDGINYYKYDGNPVLPTAPNNSPDFRDPKVWKHGDYYYVVLGSKTDNELGRILLYRSEDMYSWEFLTVLAESDGFLGYMFECPDFFELNGKYVLLFSPQGVEPVGDRYKNTYQTGYIVGSFDYDTFVFTQEQDFQELDYGHDFYATQTAEAADGRRLVVGWFGMWEVPHPEDSDGWAGAMTIIRELELDANNRLLMHPVTEMTKLRGDLIYDGEFKSEEDIELGKAAELLIDFNLEEGVELQLEGLCEGYTVLIRWDIDNQKVVIEREGDDIRQVEWAPTESSTWRLFLDTSSLELFCGDGEVVFSSRAYPLGGWKISNLSEQKLNVSAYSLNRGVPE